jgi:thiol-disulfide isomerase/thioredoxin
MGLFTPAPASFDGATAWINSEPLTADALKGKVVLVDLWTFTCINWLRTEPYIRGWARAYRDDGLVVVGVHTPEFGFEHDVPSIERAVKQFDIDYPVAVDSDYGIWSAFDNHYWPALYFIDRDGMIVDHHFGEGRYEKSERVIQDLLGIDRPMLTVTGEGVEAEADWATLNTPETYLGSERGRRSGDWRLTGMWSDAGENIVLDEAGGSIQFTFHARDVHLVMRPPAGKSIPFTVTLDGKAPGAAHGGDIGADGAGVLTEGRLWQLIRVPDEVRERTVEITFADGGAAAYSFTFG